MTIHEMQFHCCDCDRSFVDEPALHQHVEDKIHEARTKAKVRSLLQDLQLGIQTNASETLETRKGWNNTIHLPSIMLSANPNALDIKGARSNLLLLRHGFIILEADHLPPKITREKLHSAVQSNDVNRAHHWR